MRLCTYGCPGNKQRRAILHGAVSVTIGLCDICCCPDSLLLHGHTYAPAGRAAGGDRSEWLTLFISSAKPSVLGCCRLNQSALQSQTSSLKADYIKVKSTFITLNSSVWSAAGGH
jgi:hypothetical protein